jgi:hypothetical protein
LDELDEANLPRRCARVNPLVYNGGSMRQLKLKDVHDALEYIKEIGGYWEWMDCCYKTEVGSPRDYAWKKLIADRLNDLASGRILPKSEDTCVE